MANGIIMMLQVCIIEKSCNRLFYDKVKFCHTGVSLGKRRKQWIFQKL